MSTCATLNPAARLVMFGQELNPESYAICKADMLIKGQDVNNIIFGNTLAEDGHAEQPLRLHALQPALWRRVEEDREAVRAEYERKGFAGPLWRRVCPRARMAACSFCCTWRQDARRPGWRQPHRHRAQRLAPVYRWGRLRRIQHPQVDHRERLAGDHRCAAHGHVLQHRASPPTSGS